MPFFSVFSSSALLSAIFYIFKNLTASAEKHTQHAGMHISTAALQKLIEISAMASQWVI